MLLLGLVTGIAFGAVLSLSGLSSPRRIVDMLRFRDLHLLKVLVTAIAAGILGIAALDGAGLAHLAIKPLHVAAVLSGGVVFGAGFALGGYCPGTCLAAAAEGRRDAVFAVLGGLLGSAVFALAYAGLAPALVDPLSCGSPTLPSVLGVPRIAVAGPLAAAGAIAIAGWLRGERRARRAGDRPAGEAASARRE